MTRPLSFTKQCCGASLLEVLIALVVVSIGLLGMASLQLSAMKDNQVALEHTQASSLAYEALDLMRASRQQALSGSYDLPLGISAPSGTSIPAVDLQTWKNHLALSLPNGDGGIIRNGNSVVTIKIKWNESRSGGDTNKQFVFTSEL